MCPAGPLLIWIHVKTELEKHGDKAPEDFFYSSFRDCVIVERGNHILCVPSHAQFYLLNQGYLCLPLFSFYFFMGVKMFVSDARTDIRNNENKLALEMATNAQCASLLKRKQGSSK